MNMSSQLSPSPRVPLNVVLSMSWYADVRMLGPFRSTEHSANAVTNGTTHTTPHSASHTRSNYITHDGTQPLHLAQGCLQSRGK